MINLGDIQLDPDDISCIRWSGRGFTGIAHIVFRNGQDYNVNSSCNDTAYDDLRCWCNSLPEPAIDSPTLQVAYHYPEKGDYPDGLHLVYAVWDQGPYFEQVKTIVSYVSSAPCWHNAARGQRANITNDPLWWCEIALPEGPIKETP